METLETSRVCRLCGKQSGISINIFDKNENHVKKINAVLPIMVHEMDLLPKHMCHRCSYKLEEFHKFYVDCLRTDASLKSQLSWMRKEDSKERIGVPMVHIENVKIKAEPPDYDIYELDPIVENANYINSMSSVTFPVNGVQGNGIHEGIAYATYARCTCCCDKTDQSNRTLSNDYEKSVSRCSRVNEGETRNLGSSKLQAVKRNLLEEDGFQDRRTNVRSCLDTSKDIRRCRPMEMRDTPTNLGNIDGAKMKSIRPREADTRSTIVRNLRPRKGSVDYVGTRKKSSGPSGSNISSRSRSTVESKVPLLSSPKFELPQIKVEVNDFEGRILRPRKGTIDYIGPKRKYMRSIDKEQRSQGEDYYAKRHKARNNIGSKSKTATSKISELFAESGIKLAIKQEMLDFEDTVLDGSMSTTSLLPKNHRRTNGGAGSLDDDDDPSDGVDALPNNLLLNVQNGIANYSVRGTRAQLSSSSSSSSSNSSSNFHVADKLKALTSMTKSRLKSDKIGLNRIEAIAYSPKYLRSQDAYLRSGRVKKFNDAERSARKLRKNLRNFAEKTRSTGKSLMKAIKGTVGTKKAPASIKLIDNNIKHYCEKCNVSFANKELYKLHACYD